ncbi:MAG: transcription factor S [Candidatus Methanofastidiosia archaeon]
MEFCPKCGGLLIPKEGKLFCRCGFTKPLKNSDREKYRFREISKEKSEIPIIEEEISQMPKTDAECSRCGNDRAYYWMLQTRAADEPMTKFYRCTKCKYTWREYD